MGSLGRTGRLFLVLGVGSAVCVFAIVLGLVWLSSRVSGVGLAAVVAGGLALLFVLSSVFAMLYRGSSRFLGLAQRAVLRVSVPLVLGLGRLGGMDRDRIRLSFVSLNNRVLPSVGVPASDLVVLLPRCLQPLRMQCNAVSN